MDSLVEEIENSAIDEQERSSFPDTELNRYGELCLSRKKQRKSENILIQMIDSKTNILRTFSNWKNPDNFYVYIYSAKKFKGEPKESDEGKPRTISLNKVNEVPSNPGDKKMYEWLKDGRNFIGVIKHNKNKIDEAGTFVDYF